MPRRKWNTWPTRFGKALTETSGIVGLAGIAISAAGAIFAAPVILGAGGVTIGGALLYAGYRGIPPELKSASELVGTSVPIQVLDEIDHPILKLGIVGSSQSGKTTFLQQVLQQPPETTRTHKVYAAIVALQTTPVTYIALIDGDGEQFAHQFEVVENADFILIFLDHNLGDANVAKSKERIDEHDRFIKQLEFHLKQRKQIARVHLVLNKRDLWEKSKSSDELQDWFNTHVNSLKHASYADVVTSGFHSNIIAADIGRIMRIISEEAETLE